ncbi:MAG: endonuclease III [Christensenellales bacterium]|jgi:endonuclease-3
MTQRERMDEIIRRLGIIYHDVACGLAFETPFQLLVATMLSAQTTDVQVNKVTSELFLLYRTPLDFAGLAQQTLEPLIKSCGYYHTKAKHIIAASRMILQEYGGEVPDTIKELMKLPGVGRKTANVVYANAFGGDAIAVDTHVFRVANRLGLAKAKNVEKTEMQLMQNIPKEQWSKAHHWIIWHGRRICSARKPKCETCPLADVCSFYMAQVQAS